MSLGLWNLQWLNHNSQRAYPIADWATKHCTISDEIRIPDDFLLAVNFAVSCAMSVNTDQFYISSLSIMPTGISITLGYNGYANAVAVSHILRNTSEEITTAALTGLNEFDDTIGYLAINPNSTIFNLTPGYYSFSYEDSALEADCIRPMIRGVSSIRVKTGGGYSERLYGDITLLAGSNVTIDIIGNNTIRISAVNNDKYETVCDDIDTRDRPCITSINGVAPSSSGAITITGAECVSVAAENGGIRLTDTCAKPCCGCPELAALEEQIKRLQDGKVTLEQFISDLVTSVSSIESQILSIVEGK